MPLINTDLQAGICFGRESYGGEFLEAQPPYTWVCLSVCLPVCLFQLASGDVSLTILTSNIVGEYRRVFYNYPGPKNEQCHTQTVKLAEQLVSPSVRQSITKEFFIAIQAQKMSSATLRLFSLAEQWHTQNFYLRCFKSDLKP